jgi:hypothetical protein
MYHVTTRPIDQAASAKSKDRQQESLYRVLLVGGPFDGHDEASPLFPTAHIELHSGPTDGCGTRSGTLIIPRVAQYRLTSTRVCLAESAPIVECRYAYQGTAAGRSPKVPFWKTCLQWVRSR